MERMQKLLAILQKREQTPAMIARIKRVEGDIEHLKQSPSDPVTSPAKPKPKKKRMITQQVEIETEEDV
jgi:hypothetical protein